MQSWPFIRYLKIVFAVTNGLVLLFVGRPDESIRKI